MSGVELVALGLTYLLGWIFLVAALPKFTQARDFERAVAGYRILPPALVRPSARLLPWIELALAFGFFLGPAPLAGGIAAVLVLAFAIAATANLLRGRELECGCLGTASPRRVSWYLVAKDVLLVLAAAFTVLSAPWGFLALGGVIGSDAVALAALTLLLVVGEMLIVEFVATARALKTFGREAATGV